jgi:polar amino acid transport system permease protein
MAVDAANRASDTDRPGIIHARPVPHPGRWVALAVIVILVAMMISSFVTNPKWDFGFAFQVMNYKPVLNGLIQGTIIVTFASMAVGIVLGIMIAVMRLSTNPVLSIVSFAFTWFFRAIPRYVLLTLLGVGVLYLYPRLDFGLPFGMQIAHAMGISNDFTIGSIDVRTISSGIIVGIFGLGVSEAAYMAEIARAGILSVDRGQAEAAQALGMSPGQTMRRIILPQAMRVIVPPTGNETVAMVKDTSLLVAIPVNAELFYQASAVANRTYKIMPSYVAAVLWYLIVCSVLMVGQFYLERYFGRGFGTKASKKQAKETEAVTVREGAAGGGTGGM